MTLHRLLEQPDLMRKLCPFLHTVIRKIQQEKQLLAPPHPNYKPKKQRKFKYSSKTTTIPFWSLQKRGLLLSPGKGQKLKTLNLLRHICPQGLSTFLPLITKGDRLEIEGITQMKSALLNCQAPQWDILRQPHRQLSEMRPVAVLYSWHSKYVYWRNKWE